MKNCFWLLAFLFWGPFALHAQVPGSLTQPDSAIKVNVVPSGRYTRVLYSVNNEPLTTATLKKLLEKYPESASELHKYRAKKRLTLLLLPVFVAATIVGGTEADQHKDVAGSAFSKAPLPFSISLGAFFGSLVFLATNNHFEKAIEAYNRGFHQRSGAAK